MKFLPFIHASLIATSLLLVSCERQKQLLREKERLEAEYQQTVTDIQTIEQRMLALGSQVANLERQALAAEQKAAYLQSEVGSLESRVKALEDASKEFASKVDAYKAKYLR
jgi:peptidoglycan hydrolase CwlO-like protein